MEQSNNRLEYPLSEVKNVVHKWLYLEDDRIIDVLLGTFLANQLGGDPVWLVVIGPSSSTKTELLRAFDGHRKIHLLSNLTTSTLVSGLERADKEDPSLLLNLDGKIIILKDFTTIISLRSEQQQEILSQLREIYDGKYSKAFGTGKEVVWEGRVGLVAACTPIYDDRHAVISALGDRFVLYRTQIGNGKRMAERALEMVGKETDMRIDLQKAFHTFVDQFRQMKVSDFYEGPITTHMMISLACFCAGGRCGVKRDYRLRTISYVPEAEGPTRLVKQFKQIGMGIALAQGKNQIDSDVYSILKRIGRDLLPKHRRMILDHLWREKAFEDRQAWQATKDIAPAVRLGYPTVKLVLEELNAVKVLNMKTDPQEWQISQQYFDYAKEAEVFK
jgi:hypothetical protein